MFDWRVYIQSTVMDGWCSKRCDEERLLVPENTSKDFDPPASLISDHTISRAAVKGVVLFGQRVRQSGLARGGPV